MNNIIGEIKIIAYDVLKKEFPKYQGINFVEIEIIPTAWDGLLQGLESGVFDIVVNGVDVTDIMNQSGLRLYEFERSNMWGKDDKGILDSAWNLANKGRTQVTLTHEDIVFIGNINMVFNDELLETEYQKLK